MQGPTRTAPALLALVLIAGCGGQAREPADRTPAPQESTGRPSSPEPSSPEPSSQGPSGASTLAPRVVGTVARDLAVPWGIAFLPDGSALVTERDTGRVLLLTGEAAKGMEVSEVATVDASTTSGGESGLLGIAVSPGYAENHRVFLYLTTPTDNRILRATFRDGRLTDRRAILTGIPHSTYHDGGRLAFGPDGRLYASTGDAGQSTLAHDPDSLGGKILRLDEEGRPAPGNPDPSSPVWTLGHRNVQGLAFDETGRLWASEFGQDTWDELNLIRKGHDYGWPQVEGTGGGQELTDPVRTWSTDEASPSGLAYAAGSLWLGALRGTRLWQVPLDGAGTERPKDWFVGEAGRMRTVVTAPDGMLWVTTSNRDGRGSPGPDDDRILLVRP